MLLESLFLAGITAYLAPAYRSAYVYLDKSLYVVLFENILAGGFQLIKRGQ
jgi:hypothetical protein